MQFLEAIIKDIEEDAQVDEARQFNLVEVILRIDLEEFFMRNFKVADRDHAKVERRIKFMLHPDKNTHRNAKDAFQKMCNSMSKWKSKRRSLSSLLLLNIPTTFTCPVACAA